MARSDGRIEAGEPLGSSISARAWNRAQDAADIVLGTRPGFAGNGVSYSASPYIWVYAVNATNAAVSRWGVMAIANVEILPGADGTDATVQFERMPVLRGEILDGVNQYKDRCVAIDPMEAGAIGRVAIAGAVQLKVADLPKVPAATVVWKDETWAIVRLGMELFRLGYINGTWNKNSNTTVWQTNADGSAMSPPVTFDAYNWFATIEVLSGTKRVACGRVNDSWILVAAEC